MLRGKEEVCYHMDLANFYMIHHMVHNLHLFYHLGLHTNIAETKDDLEYVFPIEFLHFINNNANMTIPITLNPSSIPKILFKTNKNCK